MTGTNKLSGRMLAVVFAIICVCRASSVLSGERDLIGRWLLAGDGRDSSGNGLDAANHGVEFRIKSPGGKTAAATFNGKGNYLAVPSASALAFGRGDFTASLWLHTKETLDDDLGDLVTLYDAKRRVGFNLSLRTNTGVTSCQANTRHLQFGIDAGTEPKWIDEGRPGNAVFAFSLAVHDGNLYAGTASNGKDDVGHVYRYEGPGRWHDCGAPDKSNAISAMAVHKGKLYAASSKYRFAGSALKESENLNLGGGVYRFDGEKRWTEVGRLPAEAIGGLVVYKGELYASSMYKPAGFFRYQADGKWASLSVPDAKRVAALGAYNGFLWATSYDGGRVYRYDGASWKDFGRLGDNTQTYSFAIHRGRLCVGTWPSGKVYRLKDDEQWEDLGRLGAELEVMGMLVHNGQLYAGTLPLAEVYRYEGGPMWAKIAQLDRTPDVRYRRAWTMAQYKGRLFISTLPSGRIHSMEVGQCVTYDRELTPGWRHIAAVKEGGMLRLYVDGKLVAESSRFDPAKFDLTTNEPMLIGAGSGGFFDGAMSDVRLYRRALSAEEIARSIERETAGKER